LYYLLNEFDEAFFGRKFSLYWIFLCWNMIENHFLVEMYNPVRKIKIETFTHIYIV